MRNPWGLTQREIEAVEALIHYGVNKTAAHHLGRSVKSIELRLRRAKAKTGQHTYGLIALWAAHTARTAA